MPEPSSTPALTIQCRIAWSSPAASASVPSSDRALLRRRLACDGDQPSGRQVALRRGDRRTLLFQLWTDPRRLRRAAQPAEGRRSVRRHRVAWPGLLMSETAIETRTEEPPRRL